MKVSEGAWHVTVVRRLNRGYRPRDLCSHFWMVQGALAIWGVFGLAVGAGVTAAVWGLIVAPALTGWPWSAAKRDDALGIVHKTYYFIDYSILAAMLLMLSIVWVERRWLKPCRERRRAEKQQRRKQQHREPSLLWAFLMAKKRKVCPLIELVPEGRQERPASAAKQA